MFEPEVRRPLRKLQAREEMGMNGTPSYVIGKQVVIGAVVLTGLKEKIGIAAAARRRAGLSLSIEHCCVAN